MYATQKASGSLDAAGVRPARHCLESPSKFLARNCRPVHKMLIVVKLLWMRRCHRLSYDIQTGSSLHPDIAVFALVFKNDGAIADSGFFSTSVSEMPPKPSAKKET